MVHIIDKATVSAALGTDSLAPREITEGVTYSVWFPFVRDEYEPPQNWSADGTRRLETWRPGWRYVPRSPEDTEPEWDGDGEERRLLVAICKPGRYPARAFYVRQWSDPDGKIFGKTALRMTTLTAFRKWSLGEPKARILYDIGGYWRTAEAEKTFQRRIGRSEATITNASPASGMNP